MRVSAAMVVVCLASGSAVAAPPLDSVLADAAAADKPVVLELGATWCKPCRLFEAKVLPRPEVAAALANVVLVSYDLDTPEGQVVAEKYGVSAVPAFVVVAGREGSELERIVGLPSPRAFVQMLERVPAKHREGLALLRAIEQHPDDMAARLRLGDFERASGRTAEAAIQYREIVNAKSVEEAVMIPARAALTRIETAWELTRGLDNDIVELTHKPGTRRATDALARLAVAHRLAGPRLRQLAIAHLDKLSTSRPDDAADAIRAAILAGASQEALASLVAWRKLASPRPTALRLLDADVAMYLGDWVVAHDLVEALCRHAPGSYELACYARRATLAGSEHALLPGLGHLAAATRIALNGATPDPRTDLEALGDLDAPFGHLMAAALLDASESCAAVAELAALPAITFARGAGGLPRIEMIRDTHEAPVAKCLRETIAAHRLLPMPPGVATLVLPIDVVPVAPHPIEITRGPDVPPRPLPADLAAFAAFRTGALETRGVGAQGLVDVTRLSELRLIALGHAELASTDGSDASFVAHAMIGAGYVSNLFGVWSIAAGVGASQYGAMAPAALEFPIQLRLGFTVGGVRAALWGQSVVFPKEPMRQEHRLGGDEISVGLSASIPKTHVFIGGVVEDRVAGRTAVVLLGVPFEVSN